MTSGGVGSSGLHKPAKQINQWKVSIRAGFTYRVSNGASEGINKKIKIYKNEAMSSTTGECFFWKVLTT